MMNVRDSKGLTPMDRLIEKLPDAAQVSGKEGLTLNSDN